MSTAPSLTPAEARLFDRICDRFEASWQRGEPPHLEDHLAGVDLRAWPCWPWS